MKVSVYLDDGRVFEYEVDSPEKAREHSHAIVKGGYRHNNGDGVFEHYGSHRVLKVKCTGEPIPTKYKDTSTGT